MDLRKMTLPQGWYPKTRNEARLQIAEWGIMAPVNSTAIAGVVPHAGWYFSGEMAWNIISQIPRDVELVVIAGGHLAVGSEPLLMNNDALETPFGALMVDKTAVNELCGDFKDDLAIDNTVEIQLPMIKHHLKDVSVLPVRLSPDNSSIEWANKVAEFAKNKKIFFLGSTDLSHYGMRFGYTDYGIGEEARRAIQKNDSSFLKALQSGECRIALDLALNEKSACSAGAAVAAASFSTLMGAEGKIVDQRYSYQVLDDATDFVGYGSLLYCL